MTVVDACVVISFLAGDTTPEVEALADLLANAAAILAPSTITELLSEYRLRATVKGRLD